MRAKRYEVDRAVAVALGFHPNRCAVLVERDRAASERITGSDAIELLVAHLDALELEGVARRVETETRQQAQRDRLFVALQSRSQAERRVDSIGLLAVRTRAVFDETDLRCRHVERAENLIAAHSRKIEEGEVGQRCGERLVRRALPEHLNPCRPEVSVVPRIADRVGLLVREVGVGGEDARRLRVIAEELTGIRTRVDVHVVRERDGSNRRQTAERVHRIWIAEEHHVVRSQRRLRLAWNTQPPAGVMRLRLVEQRTVDPVWVDDLDADNAVGALGCDEIPERLAREIHVDLRLFDQIAPRVRRARSQHDGRHVFNRLPVLAPRATLRPYRPRRCAHVVCNRRDR